MSKKEKIIFYLSFIPLALVFILCLYGYFFGYMFLGGMSYGWDGAFVGLMVAAMMIYSFPPLVLLPIGALAIQIRYIIICRKLKKSGENESAERVIRPLSKKTKTIIISAVGALAVGLTVYSFRFEIVRAFEKHNAKVMLKNADERIEYDMGQYHLDGIFGFEGIIHDSVLIDYSTHEVGFLINSGTDEFWKIRLDRTESDSGIMEHISTYYYVQAVIPLSGEGKRLISFSPDEENTHRTVALVMEMQDGTIYAADNIREKDTGYVRFTGLCWSEYFTRESIKMSDLQ